MSLAEIDPAAKAHADACQVLADRLAELRDNLEAARRAHMPGIRRALNKAAELEAQLKALIVASPECFKRPKTLVMHGTKVGFEKSKGKVTFDKAADVVKRIKRLMPEKVDLLIHTKEEPNKEALAKLPAADLKRLGCAVGDTGDKPVVRQVGSELEKMVKALLKDATDDAEADAAEEAEA